jgi:hypothetical protein
MGSSSPAGCGTGGAGRAGERPETALRERASLRCRVGSGEPGAIRSKRGHPAVRCSTCINGTTHSSRGPAASCPSSETRAPARPTAGATHQSGAAPTRTFRHGEGGLSLLSWGPGLRADWHYRAVSGVWTSLWDVLAGRYLCHCRWLRHLSRVFPLGVAGNDLIACGTDGAKGCFRPPGAAVAIGKLIGEAAPARLAPPGVHAAEWRCRS